MHLYVITATAEWHLDRKDVEAILNYENRMVLADLLSFGNAST
jgi:hypothetical protein